MQIARVVGLDFQFVLLNIWLGYHVMEINAKQVFELSRILKWCIHIFRRTMLSDNISQTQNQEASHFMARYLPEEW